MDDKDKPFKVLASGLSGLASALESDAKYQTFLQSITAMLTEICFDKAPGFYTVFYLDGFHSVHLEVELGCRFDFR